MPIIAAALPISPLAEKSKTQIIVGIERMKTMKERTHFTTKSGEKFSDAKMDKKKAKTQAIKVVKRDSENVSKRLNKTEVTLSRFERETLKKKIFKFSQKFKSPLKKGTPPRSMKIKVKIV